MTNQIVTIKGMHCASCASIITKNISRLSGIKEVSVNFANEKARLSYDESKVSLQDMNDAIEKLGYRFEQNNGLMQDPSHDHNHIEKVSDKELVEQKKRMKFVVPTTFIIFVYMMWDIVARTIKILPEIPVSMEIINPIFTILATGMMFWIGKPFIQGVKRFFIYRVANMDTLIGMGTLVAYIYSVMITLFPGVREALGVSTYTYFDVVIVVIGFITLGKYLEVRSKKKTGDAIEKLLNLQAKTALVVREGKEVEIPVDQVVKGDLIVVKPGTKIPVDGEIVDGASFIDESMVTGEPMPVSKKAGDKIVAGTINTNSSFTFKATKVGSETLLAHIIKMVEEAQGSKAPIQALADKISGVFVPIVLVLAFVALGLWIGIGSQYLGFAQALSLGIVSFVGILVIACPCALGLATPTAIIVGVGKGAREGILIKDAATLQKLYKVDTVVVDKTGTITYGKPELTDVTVFAQQSEKEIVSILASLEKKSEHPIAHAIVSYAQEKSIEVEEVSLFEAIKGKGLKGVIGHTTYYAGNEKLVVDLGLSVDTEELKAETKKGKTPIFLATENKLVALVFVSDKVKDNAKAAITKLHKLGIKVVMLTGDNKHTAEHIAKEVGIDEVVAEVLPEDKLKKVQELQSQGHIVAMAGDGVNDAPALAQADVGVAMSTGTDVAIESAGITLLHGDISKLLKAIRLSKITMRGIQQNLFWAFIYNVVGIPLAGGLFYPIWGILLSPVFAGLAMAFSSVSVVGNSLRLKAKKL